VARFPLAPASTIGILGGGQLGRMLAMAAARLGFDVAVLEPEPDSPAGRVAAHVIARPYDDSAGLKALAKLSDVITFEFENVPAEVVAGLQALGCEVAPGPLALATAQDRVDEKSFMLGIGVQTVAFEPIESIEDVLTAIPELDLPALLKTRRQGYDGKGQMWVKDAHDAEAAFERIGRKPAIMEARADFARELSIIAARGRGGEIAIYPLAENVHEHGVLRRSIAPAHRVSAEIRESAEAIVRAILEGLDYVGVLAVELFELKDGRLLVNEIAPRVHNSGHWTLDGCEVDQFEQHIRAIAGWPLGPTEAIAETEMTNLLGDEADDWKKLAADPSARLWLYGKREGRAGRKMGHVNRLKLTRGR
jgi:5-(carboxyamino)imidazole ribonucleotide synthase